jgi:uncharacterized repeat protein (TIGR03803 family)
VVFKITPNGTPTILHTMTPTDGQSLFDGVVQATDGDFYGEAEMGGNTNFCYGSGCGTLFQVTPASDFSVLQVFAGISGMTPSPTGMFPDSPPFQHTNGLLYGDTSEGGECTRCGVLFSWDAGLPTFVSLTPNRGEAGHFVEILGQGFTSATTVSFNGVPAPATIVSGTYLSATVPAGATTGFVTVTTSSGTLTSNRQFVVAP